MLIYILSVKVLYTFDGQSKTNCLARWPRVLNVRTAYLDETTQIGIVDLKTCIQAIVAASPELVATLGQDYTVYAYDYSECDTPLVGQGMLSWVLATPSAPANQSRTCVTGRVCKSILGLFSGGPQETLEVKLRLVPVPTCLQSEYIESMNKYRELSKIMPEGFNAQAWTDFIQSHPGLFSSADRNAVGSPAFGTAPKDIGIEHVQRLFREGYASQSGQEQGQYDRRDSYGGTNTNEDPYRTASPAMSTQSNTMQPLRQQNTERAISRDSSRLSQQPMDSRRNSIDIGDTSNGERQDGPPKKRAKVTRAEWPAKGSFGKQIDSLRVAASSAASVRVFQPTAIHPPTNPVNSLEQPPRVPTPTPRTGNQHSRPPLATGRSGLGRALFSIHDTEYQSPYAIPDVNSKPASSATTSPEDYRGNSISNTPPPGEIASSPPVFRDATPSPSSPVLPTLPRGYDSGFMSGPLDDLVDDDEDRPLDEFDLEIAARYNRRTDAEPSHSFVNEEHTTSNLNPMISAQYKEPTTTVPLPDKSSLELGKPRNLSRTESTGMLQPSTVATSDPVRPVSGMLQRSQTWSGQQFQHPVSDVSVGSEGPVASKRAKSGSGVKRKAQLVRKLHSTIAAGEMPPWCDNCGAIETPTWRKAWTKTHSGTPVDVQISKSEGGIVAIQNLEECDGVVSLFKIFKKSLLETDVGFTEVLLCNRKLSFSFSQILTYRSFSACGLWLHNRQCSRPRNLWKSRDQSDDNDKKGGKGKAKKGRTGGATTQSTDHSYGTALPANGSSPAEGASEDPQIAEGDELQLPYLKTGRASSLQVTGFPHSKSEGMNDSVNAAALQRAVQSSPPRLIGSQQTPIDLDGPTLNSTRRILFPSPNRSGEATAPAENYENGNVTVSENDSKEDHGTHEDSENNNADKENQAPDDEEFDDLFDEAQAETSRPSTPPPRLTEPNPFQTPTQQSAQRSFLSPGNVFSGAKAFFYGQSTPNRTPSKTSPRQQIPLEEMTPLTRHFHEFFSDGGLADSSPSTFIDFSSLPNLGGSTSSDQYLDGNSFEYNGFTSTDAPMPSSPRPGFGVYEDLPGESIGFNGDAAGLTGSESWMLNFGSSPLKAGLKDPAAEEIEEDIMRGSV